MINKLQRGAAGEQQKFCFSNENNLYFNQWWTNLFKKSFGNFEMVTVQNIRYVARGSDMTHSFLFHQGDTGKQARWIFQFLFFPCLKSSKLLTLWGQMGGGELKDFSGVWLRFYKKNTLSDTCFQWRTSPSKSLATEVTAYFLVLAISIFEIYFWGVKQFSY